ncbi:hypothetical protein [Persephonella sp.]|uniref:hypothetical protein n=1 Tax=Persephonella sp. TaxID=2060922 RepID=UPI00260D12B4|nr:hypothetical protein [Persephonella sp.]
MKIYSVYHGNQIRKGISLKKKGDELIYLSFDRVARSKTYLSIHYPDIINSTVSLPNLINEETRNLLTKNKLSNLLQPEKDYTFVFFPKEKISETETLFEVYAFPVDIYQQLTSEYGQIDFLTVDIFSLIPFSLGGKTFHFYSDKEKILISVYEDMVPLYTRAVSIPESTSEEQYINYLYENFSVTYSFVSQNKRINVDNIIISGLAFDNEEFINLVYDQVRKPIVNLIPMVKGLNPQQFNEFIVEIGTTLLNETFDFLPLDIKKERFFSGVIKQLSFFLILLTAAILFIDFIKFSKVQEVNQQVSVLKQQIENKLHKIHSIFKPEEINYYRKYFSLLNKSLNSFPDNIMLQISDLLFLLDEKKFEINKGANSVVISIVSTQNFNSIAEMENFKYRLNLLISQLKGFKINKSIQEDLQNFRLYINLTLEKGLKNEVQ